MKVRLGFVSNSSASSFCIYGIELDYNAIKKAVKKLYKEDLLNLSVDGGEFSVERNSHLSLVNDAIGHVWRGRINSLMDRIFIIETKALVTDSMVDFQFALYQYT